MCKLENCEVRSQNADLYHCLRPFSFISFIGVFQPGEEKAPGRPPVPEGTHKKAGEGLFTKACNDRTRGNDFKLKEDRFRSDIRKKFFTLKVVKLWPRLPREAVAAPSPAVSRARLDGALSTLVSCKVSLPTVWGWNWMIFKVPSNPNHGLGTE